jgi:hypothetical protein
MGEVTKYYNDKTLHESRAPAEFDLTRGNESPPGQDSTGGDVEMGGARLYVGGDRRQATARLVDGANEVRVKIIPADQQLRVLCTCVCRGRKANFTTAHAKNLILMVMFLGLAFWSLWVELNSDEPFSIDRLRPFVNLVAGVVVRPQVIARLVPSAAAASPRAIAADEP